MVTSRFDRWGPIAGIVFAVLFVVGIAMTVGNLPQGDDSAQEISNFYNDSGDRLQLIAGGYLMILAGVFFFWFLASLRTRLIAAEGEPSRLTPIAYGSGLVFTGLLMASACAFISVAGDVSFGGEKFASADAARYLPELGYPLLVIAGMFAVIAMIDAASIVIRRTGVLPVWIAYFGFVTAVILLASVFFIPMVLFVLWVVFVSVAMLRARPVVGTPSVPD